MQNCLTENRILSLTQKIKLITLHSMGTTPHRKIATLILNRRTKYLATTLSLVALKKELPMKAQNAKPYLRMSPQKITAIYHERIPLVIMSQSLVHLTTERFIALLLTRKAKIPLREKTLHQILWSITRFTRYNLMALKSFMNTSTYMQTWKNIKSLIARVIR